MFAHLLEGFHQLRAFRAVDRAVIEAVGAIAKERGVERASVALAWQFSKPAMVAPIIGATKPGHIAAAVAATGLALSEEEIRALLAQR